MPLAHMVELSALATLILALVTLFIGKGVRAGVPWLKRISLPDAVVGGLLVALLVLILHIALAVDLRFDKAMRDLLLLIFFATIGLSAKLRMLATGGRPLLILCLAILLLIFLQNLVGAAVALAFGAHPFYGLLAGGLSFVGGPGTALAWAREAEAAGLEAAPAVGIGAATLATIAGALFAGPISGFLISRHGLRPPDRSPSGISFTAVRAKPPLARPPRADEGPGTDPPDASDGRRLRLSRRDHQRLGRGRRPDAAGLSYGHAGGHRPHQRGGCAALAPRPAARRHGRRDRAQSVPGHQPHGHAAAGHCRDHRPSSAEHRGSDPASFWPSRISSSSGCSAATTMRR